MCRDLRSYINLVLLVQLVRENGISLWIDGKELGGFSSMIT